MPLADSKWGRGKARPYKGGKLLRLKGLSQCNALGNGAQHAAPNNGSPKGGAPAFGGQARARPYTGSGAQVKTCATPVMMGTFMAVIWICR